MKRLLVLMALVGMVHIARADGPRDNIPEKVRQIPPPGIQLADSDRQELTLAVKALGMEIDKLRQELKDKPQLLELLPDVQIYHNAVRYALTYNEFFHTRELKWARQLLQHGRQRARLLRQGKTPWTTATGLVVRGYQSRIDRSVQPYGLVVPRSYRPDGAQQHRLDLWFHGRGEKLSEVNFLRQRQTQPGRFTPKDAFVLHPYGRYSNAYHFAGEVDTFEALAHVRKHYPIDENRISVRGFSMGGAACWHYAAHHAGKWVAAAPGAGFSETPEFLRVFQGEKLKPTWYERKLWQLYDCTDYALNLYHCPVVAYSGEIDRQKQAADIMARAMKQEGLHLVHIIGPKTGHRYHPRAKEEINRRIDAIVARGRNPVPRTIRFTTRTLRYHRMLWVVVDGLQQHWEPTRVEAEILNDRTVKVKTQNVTALTLTMPPGHCPLENTQPPWVVVDGTKLQATPVLSDRSWEAHFHKSKKGWQNGTLPTDGKIRKRHGLQGPIDDAFMDSFLMVSPTGKARSDRVEQWVAREMKHALVHWRKQFRGEARIKKDVEVTAEDVRKHHLILWGDPSSNKVLAKIADRLPIQYKEGRIHLLKQSWDAGRYVPALIYPNPASPDRYVVLNSGFTYREYDYLNNARQVPKLPDYAILDLSVPATSQRPAGIVTAGFFDEWWQPTPAR